MRFLLSDHLKGFSIVRAPAYRVREILKAQLTRFGAVEEVSLSDWASASRFLTPLKSFPTRYLVLGLEAWTIVLNNMRWESSHVDILAVSKSGGCFGVTVYFREDSRQIHLVEKGQAVRSVVCYEDGGKWFFHETGEPAKFEDMDHYSRTRIRERLTPEMVCNYFKAATGISIPLAWKECEFIDLAGLERSTQEVKVPITSWETIIDV
jgi:hypothetical protein